MWARHGDHGPENRTKLILTPHVGLLRLDLTNLWCGPRMTTRIATYTPADDPSAAAEEGAAAAEPQVAPTAPSTRSGLDTPSTVPSAWFTTPTTPAPT